MSHLRAKFQQTSGQRLYTSHHFPAQFQNILARQAGTAGDHPNVQKCFNPVCAPPALPFPTLPPVSPASLLLSPLLASRPAGGQKHLKKSELSKQTGIFCRRSLVSAACPTIAFAK